MSIRAKLLILVVGASAMGLAASAAVFGVASLSDHGTSERTAFLGTLAALVVVASAVVWYGRRLARAIDRTAERARAMADGDLGPGPTGLHGADEIGSLDAALRRLASSVGASVARADAERDLYAGILEGMSEGVMVTDQRGLVSFANRAIRDLLGIAPSPAGRVPIDVVRVAELAEALDEATRGVGHVSREAELAAPRARTLAIHAAPLAERGGAVAVVHDITELRRLERVRRDFVANVSHELRTPIASVLGAAETLAGGALEDRGTARRFVESIHRNSARLAAIVEDLLRLSRIESGEWRYEIAELAVHRIVQQALDDSAQAAAAKRITLTNEVRDQAIAVRADETALLLVLRNLVDNAIKYSPEATRVHVAARSEAAVTAIDVHDEGLGIDAASLHRIFERFYRVDPGRSREAGGTGLGLSIVRNLVQGMGGEVSVTSEPGKGSTFRVSLPGVTRL